MRLLSSAMRRSSSKYFFGFRRRSNLFIPTRDKHQHMKIFLMRGRTMTLCAMHTIERYLRQPKRYHHHHHIQPKLKTACLACISVYFKLDDERKNEKKTSLMSLSRVTDFHSTEKENRSSHSSHCRVVIA